MDNFEEGLLDFFVFVFLSEWEMSGHSAIWTPDIVVAAKHFIRDSSAGNDYSLYLGSLNMLLVKDF
jgi:hypothetical protein